MQYPSGTIGPLNNWQPLQPFACVPACIKRQFAQFLSASVEAATYPTDSLCFTSASLNPLKSLQSAVAAGAVSAGTSAGVSAGVVVDSVFGASPPQAATNTSFHLRNFGYTTTPFLHLVGGTQNSSTQFDGFKVLANSGTMSGTVWVYGYQEA